MAINTYATLKSSVAGWMNVSATDLSDQIDDLVTIAETRIYREARTRDAETSYITAIGSGVLSVPSDYVDMKWIYCSATGTPLLRRSIEWLYEYYPRVGAVTGTPKYFARDGNNFVFGPVPDAAYTAIAVYYKKFAALSTGTNNQFLNNPDLYLFACLAESEILIGRDERIPVWEAKYNKILSDANTLAKREDTSGSPGSMPASQKLTGGTPRSV